MTPERMARLVARWVRLYTGSLPPHVAERRIDELDADLHDHIDHERARGTDERRIALSIAARMVRGMAADVSWRRKDHMKTSTNRSVLRVGLATALILLLPLIGMQFSDEVDWGVFDFVFAGVLLAGTGLLLELAARRASNLAYRFAAAAVGVAAIALGEADDAPGLVLFGCLLILGALALSVWTARRSE
jgi:hypothetical protein